MLTKIIEKYDPNIPIICHLKNEYHDIVKSTASKVQHQFIFSEITDKITSNKSLQSLEKLIIKYKNKYQPKKGNLKSEIYSKTWTRKIIKILDYQFGHGVGNKIISNGLKPKHNRSANRIEILDLKTQEKLGVFKYSTGQIELATLGLERLIRSYQSIDANFIVFDGEEIKGNTLFRAGVSDYSLDLIPYNQVVILDKKKEKVIGSGELIVGSNFIRKSKSGRIVKINE